MGRSLLTVSAVTALVKNAIAEHLPPTVHVVGQISNFKRHTSGHLYLTLKDESSELACVMWRSSAAKLAFEPQDGLEIIATGYIDVFERAGRYQLYVRKLEPRGVGALELAFRQLREKLSAEGLFDAQHKQPLPVYPQRIAVVTSPTGAAVRDVLQTLERRFPCADVLLCAVQVQGPGAAGQIAAAIDDLNRRRDALGGIDVMIVGRGGGSLEDLWAFNEEVVARAIFASRIPIISAVGHEVDVTIADLVADVRAATPTAAAELAVPDLAEVLALIERYRATLARSATHRCELSRLALAGVLRRRALADPLAVVRRREQGIDELTTRVSRTLGRRVHEASVRLRRCETLVQRIQPQGYVLRLERELARQRDRLGWAVAHRLAGSERRLGATTSALLRVSPVHRIERLGDRTDHLERRLGQLIRHRVGTLQHRLEGHAARLSAMSHKGTLRRGFSITRIKKGRRVVRGPGEVSDGQRLVTETAGGEFESQVVDRDQLDLFE
jgi:exodeoxyribonuclease VII large subunit